MRDNQKGDSYYDLERNGDYEAAAAAYARAGFELLVDGQFDPGDEHGYEGLTLLVSSISCDRRAGNTRRPEHVADVYTVLIREMRDRTDDPTDVGLLTELLGDVALMLGEDDVTTVRRYYDEANDQLEDVDWRAELRTAEPIYDMGYRAIQHFSEYHDGPLPENPESVSFQERLDRKRELARQLLDGE